MPDGEAQFRAVSVGRRSLPSLAPLMEEFAATGSSEWDANTLLRVAWAWVVQPGFALWAVVREGSGEPLGFLGAHIQQGHMEREAFVPVVYVKAGLPLGAGRALHDVLFKWAKTLGVTRLVARTKRGDTNGLAEPRAWEAVGFEYDSTIMVAKVGRQLGDGDSGEGTGVTDD